MNKEIKEQTNDDSVKNLKVYNLPKHKVILKKIRTVGLSILVGLSLLTTVACNNVYNYNKYTPTSNADRTTISQEVTIPNIIGKYQNEYAEDITSTYIIYDNANFKSFMDFLSNYQVDYLNPEVFHYDEAHEYYESHPLDKTITHTYSGIINNGKVDEEALFQAVKKNSPEYKTSGNHYLYQLIEDDSEIRAIIRYVAASINEDLPYKTEDEIKEIDCTLANLKIYYGAGVESAKVTMDGSLLVNEPMIDAIKITSGIDEAYRDVMYHETKHLEQIDCVDHKNYEHNQQGISRTNPNLLLDPYSWTWTAEGGAELGSINMTNDPAATYNYLVGYMETLDLISMTNPNNQDGKAIERSTINRDIQEFYKAIGVDNIISEEELVKMMSAMEIVQSRVKNYGEVYEKTYGTTFDESTYQAVRETYRSQFLIESSKIFYNNLARRINNENNLTLEDIFALITIYEGDLNFHIKYNQGSSLSLEYNQELLRQYNEIQTEFFESISIANLMDYQTIMYKFNNYKLFVQDGKKIKLNATLSWLNDDQVNWLLNKATGKRMALTKPVNLVVEEELEKSNSK